MSEDNKNTDNVDKINKKKEKRKKYKQRKKEREKKEEEENNKKKEDLSLKLKNKLETCKSKRLKDNHEQKTFRSNLRKNNGNFMKTIQKMNIDGNDIENTIDIIKKN